MRCRPYEVQKRKSQGTGGEVDGAAEEEAGAPNWERGGYSKEAFAKLSKADKIRARAKFFDESEKELEAKREKQSWRTSEFQAEFLI